MGLPWRALLAIVALFFSVTGAARASGCVPLDIVFDIDWTLFYSFKEEPAFKDAKTFSLEGKWYRPTPHAEEVLYKASQLPCARISFFSGGESARNEKILQRLRFPDGRSARDLAFRVLSKGDLVTVSTDSKRGFSERLKKDLGKISPDLSRIVLVDDDPRFSLHGQESNMLWLGKTYNYIDDYDAWAEAGNVPGPYDPPSKAEWLRERQKLLNAYDRIAAAAKETSNRHNPSFFREALRARAPFSCSKAFSKIRSP